MAIIAAATNRTTAEGALKTQIEALVNEAAARGQYFLTTGTLAPIQQTHIQSGGYIVTLLNGIYKISWEPTPP